MIKDLVIQSLAFSCTESDRRILLPASPAEATPWETRLIIVQPGKVDAWQRFPAAMDLICAHGMVKLVLFDERRDGGSFGELHEFVTGAYRLQHFHIPAGIFIGWQCVSPGEAILHVRQTPGVSPERRPRDGDFIPYQWTGTA